MVIYTTKNQADEEKTKQKKTIQAALQSSSAGQLTSCNLLSFVICEMMRSIQHFYTITKNFYKIKSSLL